MPYIIYKLTSPSAKSYIGWTSRTFKDRLRHHKSDAKKGKQTKLSKAIRKYSFESFTKEIVYQTNNLEESYNKEKEYIQEFDSIKNGYNISIGGELAHLGCKHTEESKNKIRIARAKQIVLTGWRHTEEAKEKIKIKRKQQIISPESNLKRSNTLKGRFVAYNPARVTPEANLKRSLKMKGIKHKRIKCDYCNVITTTQLIHRWHNENCKFKSKTIK